MTPQPMLCTGVVRHRRLRPRVHAFQARTFFVLLPMRHLRHHDAPALRRNRAGWLSFHDADHGEGGPDALAWLERTLAEQGVHDADGEIWLQTYPRVLGYVFKPVSFWYCHRSDGTLAAVLAEVNNTFGERHVYLLAGPEVAWGRDLQARKVMHVSPFCRVQGSYRMRFMRTEGAIVARVEHDDDTGTLLQTSISARMAPLEQDSVRSALLRAPLMTLGVMLRIHWQALRLAAKRLPFFAKPDPPSAFVTR